MTDHTPSDDQADAPALFATIHHQSDERPDGYTAEDIAELNRLANGAGQSRRRIKWVWIVCAGLVLAGLLAAAPWAMIAWDKVRPKSISEMAALPPPSADDPSVPSEEPSAPIEDYPAPAYMDVRGLHIGQFKEDVAPAVAQRGLMLVPGNRPLMEMHFGLPRYDEAEALFVDEPGCRESMEQRANMSAEEANSLAGMQLPNCRLAGRIFYNNDGEVIAFYVTPAGFGIDRITLKDFAQAVVDNHEVETLEPEQERLRTLGFDGYCTNYLGTGWPNVRVKVSDCAFMRVQVERSATAEADFS
nr:hypothetical protein [uncultured Brevundimonas sp.]